MMYRKIKPRAVMKIANHKRMVMDSLVGDETSPKVFANIATKTSYHVKIIRKTIELTITVVMVTAKLKVDFISGGSSGISSALITSSRTVAPARKGVAPKRTGANWFM
jgi:hypothetical protein